MTPNVWRKKSHLTIEQLAKLLGIKAQTCSSYLKCRRPWPALALWALVKHSSMRVTFSATMIDFELRSGRSIGSLPRPTDRETSQS